VSNPALVWMRAVALAVVREGKTGEPLTAYALAEISAANQIEVPGVKPGQDERTIARVIGGLTRRLFQGGERVTVDGIRVERTLIEYKNAAGYDEKPAYIFQQWS
jgi:hypothetical protein